MRWIDHAKVLEAARSLDVRQQPVQKLPLALSVEDNHWHLARAEVPVHILGDDVFEECGLARPGPAHYDAMLHAHDVRPQPGLFVDVVAEHRSSVPVGATDDLRVLRSGDQYGGMGPVLFSPFSSTNELRNDDAAAEEQDGHVQEDLQTLGVAQVKARHGNVP